MTALEQTSRPTPVAAERPWLLHETRLGSHHYPLRAAALAVASGAGGAALAVAFLVRLLGA